MFQIINKKNILLIIVIIFTLCSCKSIFYECDLDKKYYNKNFQVFNLIEFIKKSESADIQDFEMDVYINIKVGNQKEKTCGFVIVKKMKRYTNNDVIYYDFLSSNNNIVESFKVIKNEDLSNIKVEQIKFAKYGWE